MGIAISMTIIGMAGGAWMGGELFDMTGSYHAAFLNGIAWNAAERRHRVVAADAPEPPPGAIECHRVDRFRYAWRRLGASVTLSTLGGIGMWASPSRCPPCRAISASAAPTSPSPIP